MYKYLLLAAMMATMAAQPEAIATAAPAQTARAGSQTRIESMQLTVMLPEDWLALGDSLSAGEEEQMRRWMGEEAPAETVAGNLALDSVCWAAVSRNGVIAYMNIYEVVLFEGCVSVSQFSADSWKSAADEAASDYGLESADRVEALALSNTDFLLVRYGDPAEDGFTAINYLFVWEGRLAGLEFVSGTIFSENEQALLMDIAASLSGDTLAPPMPGDFLSAKILPVGSEYAWYEQTLESGITLSVPEWMALVDADNVEPGLAQLEFWGVPDETQDKYRGYFRSDEALEALFANAEDYHGYLLSESAGFPEGARIDTLDAAALDSLIARATENSAAPETVLTSRVGYYGGVPMLRISSREESAHPVYYISYLFLSEGRLYTLTFLETWELSAQEEAFFDAITSSVALPVPAAAQTALEPERKVIIAIVAVVGVISLILILAAALVIGALARRTERLAPLPQPSAGEEPPDAPAPAAEPAAPRAPRYCNQCGAPLERTFRYCARCGRQIDSML
ncbi:MAG: hypothetical protein ACOX7W_01700 [Christensenellales bacterium]|jgi:hypothetical protein